VTKKRLSQVSKFFQKILEISDHLEELHDFNHAHKIRHLPTPDHSAQFKEDLATWSEKWGSVWKNQSETNRLSSEFIDYFEKSALLLYKHSGASPFSFEGKESAFENELKLNQYFQIPNDWIQRPVGDVTAKAIDYLPSFYEYTLKESSLFTRIGLNTIEKGLITKKPLSAAVFLSLFAISLDRSSKSSIKRASECLNPLHRPSASAHHPTEDSLTEETIGKGVQALLPISIAIHSPLFLIFASLNSNRISQKEIEKQMSNHFKTLAEQGLIDLLNDCKELIHPTKKAS